MRKGFLGTLVASGILLAPAPQARATTWLPPARPLTADETLDLAVSESDAVAVGNVVAIRDTIVDMVGGTGIPSRSLALHVTELLSGAVPGIDLAVGVSPADDASQYAELLARPELRSRQALFFLRRSPSGWVFREYPDPPSLQLPPPEALAAAVAGVRRAVARQSPDSLLARADLVVLGSRGPLDSRCAETGVVRECATVTVREVLAGPAAPESLRVTSAVVGHMPAGDAVYVLRRLRDGLYETVGFRSGSLSVRDGRVERWGLSVDEVRGKAERARAARPRSGR